MGADVITFRSAFFPVWRVSATWTAGGAGAILGVQALAAGAAPPVPQFVLTAFAAVISGVLVALAVTYNRVYLTAAGLRCYDQYGLYRLARWDSITEVRPTNFLGLRYLRVYSTDTRRPRWLPQFLADMPGFAEAVSRLGGPEHPLTRALPQEARRTRR